MLDADVMLVSLAAALAVMLVTWAVSVRMRDASVADISWGLAFVAIAWAAHCLGDGNPDRSLLLAIVVSVWGLRLAAHIADRHDGEDRRYVAMREKHGDAFAWRSLWSVFAIQGLLAWVISLPVQVAAIDPTPALGVLAWVGLAVFAVGFYFEAVSDFQLRQFVNSPDSGDKVMDRGLWRYSRHPNYFGEVVIWWGIYLIALETGSAWWTAIGPAVITFLLLRVSGVTLTESSIKSRRPGYEEYVRRTSAFVPRPPK